MLVRNFLYAYVLAFSGLIVNAFLYAMFVGNRIFSVSTYVFVALAIYISISYVKVNYKPIVKKLSITMDINYVLISVLILSSFIYHIWHYTFLSDLFVAKLFLVLFGMFSAYMYVMFKRALHTATKKVKNPRLTSEPNMTYFEKVREVNTRLSSDKPFFVLGIDVDVEEDD